VNVFVSVGGVFVLPGGGRQVPYWGWRTVDRSVFWVSKPHVIK